jgi:hypothetical protein
MKRLIAIFVLLVGGILASSILGGCSNIDDEITENESEVANKTIEQVQDAHTNEWMDIPGVEGTGIALCDGNPCIVIFSSKSAEELKDRIPATLDGYPIVIREAGNFNAFE